VRESSRLREEGGGGCWRDQVVVLGRVHGEVEKCFDLISDLKCRDDRYPGRCRRGFGSWGGGRWVRCALGEVVVFPKRRSRWHVETGAGDVPSPLPGEPLPQGGRFSIDTVPGVSSTVSADPPSRFCLCPVHGYPVNRHALPAPWRGREEARNAPGGGGWST